MKNLFLIFLTIICVLLNSCFFDSKKANTDAEEWTQLFNGKDMTGWIPKFNGYELGTNFNNTFQVADGFLKADYSEYDVFKKEFGHLFYKEKYSFYKLRATYRAVGEQAKGGKGWAYANNGLMLHCQPPESMTLNQEFPLSIEFQLLAGNGTEERSTGNLCTPGCHVTMKGESFTPHCVSSDSKTYHGKGWVTAEAVVYGDSLVYHLIEGDTVMRYSSPVIGGNLNGLDTLRFPAGARMTEGFISIQAESHGFDFKKIELLDLCGCMDEKAKNYKSYFVCSKPEECVY